jgi:hypothetical protein
VDRAPAATAILPEMSRRPLRSLALVSAVAASIAASAATGCTIIYDPDNLRGDDGGPDSAIDAAPPADVDPTMLMLTSLEPPALYDGAGSTGRAIPLLVHGRQIASDAVISIHGPDGAIPGLEVGETIIATGGELAATSVRVPVIGALAQGSDLELTLVVTQVGAEQTIALPLHGLDELQISGPVTLDTGTTPIAPLYASITLDGNIRFIGDAPARFVATGDIAVNGVVNVNAGSGEPGAHGCPGGDGENPGSCGNGGGHQGAGSLLQNGPGGGGGGFGGVGGIGGGQGGEAGAGGSQTGNELLVPLTAQADQPGNRGNGGGGGGTGILGGAGGRAGHGAGVLELTTGGVLTIGTDGGIEARGGSGSSGSSGGGGGGGGSGGAILLRAGGGIVYQPGTARITAPGGAGGGDDDSVGGAGGFGRIRIDTTGSINGMATTPAAIRGALWSELPLIVRTSTIDALLVGGAGRAYDLLVNEQQPSTTTLPTDGDLSIEINLSPGANTLCVSAGAGADVSVPEGLNCQPIIYLP